MSQQKYRVLVCGDRNWTDSERIYRELKALYDEHGSFTLIEGEARGADRLARQAAERIGNIVVERYPADWVRYSKAAGPIRNRQMLREGKPDLVLAFHDDLAASKGTKDMLEISRNAGVPVRALSHAL